MNRDGKMEDHNCEIGVLVDLNSPSDPMNAPAMPLNLVRRLSLPAEEDDPWGIFPTKVPILDSSGHKNSTKTLLGAPRTGSPCRLKVKSHSDLGDNRITGDDTLLSGILEDETFPECSELEEDDKENDIMSRCKTFLRSVKARNSLVNSNLPPEKLTQVEREAQQVVNNISGTPMAESLELGLLGLRLSSKPDKEAAPGTPLHRFRMFCKLNFSSSGSDEDKHSIQEEKVEEPQPKVAIEAQECRATQPRQMAMPANIAKAPRSRSLVRSKQPATFSRGPLRATLPAAQMVKETAKAPVKSKSPVKRVTRVTFSNRSSVTAPAGASAGKATTPTSQPARRSLIGSKPVSVTTTMKPPSPFRKRFDSSPNKYGRSDSLGTKAVTKPRRHSTTPQASSGGSVTKRYSYMGSAI